jgi:hypothetical protein
MRTVIQHGTICTICAMTYPQPGHGSGCEKYFSLYINRNSIFSIESSLIITLLEILPGVWLDPGSDNEFGVGCATSNQSHV